MFEPRKSTSARSESSAGRRDVRWPVFVRSRMDRHRRAVLCHRWSRAARASAPSTRRPDERRSTRPIAGAGRASVASFVPLPGPSSTIVTGSEPSAAKISRRVAAEQPHLGPRHAVPRQQRDGVEERRPERVVEIPGRQLPRLLCEVVPHVRGKRRSAARLESTAGLGSSTGIRRSSRSGTWRRRTDSVAGTSCETSAATTRAVCRRGAFHHEVLAVEEVGRIFRIRRHRRGSPGTARTRCPSTPSRCRRDPPRPRRLRRQDGCRRLRIPAREVEHAVRWRRRRVAPRDTARSSPPACRTRRAGTRLRSAGALRASARTPIASAWLTYTGHERQRKPLEHPAPVPRRHRRVPRTADARAARACASRQSSAVHQRGSS